LTTGTIHFVAGTWASGKSTLAGQLPARIPACVVFDWDLLIPGLSIATQTDVRTDPTTWPELKAIWISIIRRVAASGRDVILLGPLTSDDFSSADLGGAPYRCACLNWPDDIIADRLGARGTPRSEILEELRSAKELRSSTHYQIELAGCTLKQMIDRVATWIRCGASR
jgi:hypothetical protein